MQYQCAMCKAVFLHPAKLVITNPTTDKNVIDVFEVSTCPHCKSIEYTEAPPAESQVESVYIYELTTGSQTELNGLLAQGYVIVNRYAKVYHLEKDVSKGSFKNPDPDDNKVFMEQAEAAYKKLGAI